jgi:predicted DNA-binding protein with PD1-like motif
MKTTEGKTGRVFIIRLEDNDAIPDCIEKFAEDNHIVTALVTIIGGIGKGEIVSGPRYTDKMPPEPMLIPVDGAHEVVGIGVIAPNEQAKPVLHLHAAAGRAGQTITGCLRSGVAAWLIGEVIVYEIVGAAVKRVLDKKTGFELLEVI